MHLPIWVVFAIAAFAPSPASAAEAALSPGDCCSDLEARVDDLETTVVHKGNSILKMEVGGSVSHAVLFWNDGEESTMYVVGDDNDGTSLEFNGWVKDINGSNWSAGYTLELGVQNELSGDVSQISLGTTLLEINESHLWVRNERLGQLSWGEIGGGNDVDDATEMDLSETRVVAQVSADDIGGNFFLRRSGVKGLNGLTPVVWSDLIDHLPGIDGPEVRYDTPIVHGLMAWTEVRNGPEWEGDLAYGDPATLQDVEGGDQGDEGDHGAHADQGDEDDHGDQGGAKRDHEPGLIPGYQIAAAMSVQVIHNDLDIPDSHAVSGSISILQEATGLNFSFAGGQRFFNKPLELNDGNFGKPQDPYFIYVKTGLLLDHLIQAGHTGFYAEYGDWHDFLGRNADSEAVGGLVGLDPAEVCLQGAACLVSRSEATVWGFGAVQHVEAADMDLYIGFRRYQPDIDLVDASGSKRFSANLSDFTTVMSGGKMDF